MIQIVEIIDLLYVQFQIVTYIDNEREPDSASSRDSWWLEAAKIADDLESKPKALEPHTLENFEEDDDWWIAVEESLQGISSLRNSPKCPLT